MLKQKFIVQFGSTFLLRILTLLSGIVVARIAGPEVLGTIAFGTAYVSIWSFVNGLFSTGHIKLISEGKNLGNCVKTYTLLQTGSISVYFILVISWFLIQKHIFNYSFESVTVQVVILITLFANIFTLFLDFHNVTFTARLEQVKANYPGFIKTVIWQIGRIIIVIFGLRAIGLAGWNLAVSVLVLPLAFKLFKQLPSGNYDKTIARQYWAYVPPVALVVLMNNILNYADKLFLGYYTSVEEVGYYSAAFSIGGMFLLISKSAGMVFFPLFSRLISENKWDEITKKINVFQEFIVLVVFPIICLMFLIGKDFLITILGEQYNPSVNPFMILLFATYISIIGMPYGNILAGMGKFYLNAAIDGIKIGFFIISMIFLVSPRFLNLGATGLAFNLLTINFVGNLIYVLYARRSGTLKYDLKNLKRHMLVIIITVSFYVSIRYLNMDDGLWWIICIPVYLVAAYGSFFLSGLAGKEQVLTILDLMKVKNTIRYIGNEMNNKDLQE